MTSFEPIKDRICHYPKNIEGITSLAVTVEAVYDLTYDAIQGRSQLV